MQKTKILLGHGSGGRLTHSLIRELLVSRLNNPILKELADSARLPYKEQLAFTTDSFVVSPLFFPGGDIGKLAVCGTVNDLVAVGADPEYLSLALILEEGLDYDMLEKITGSLAFHARACGVTVVTGDIKVVEKGAADKVFINTCGVGRIIKNRKLTLDNIKPQDRIIITGEIGQHGLAVLAKRKELSLGFGIHSDCAGLNSLIIPLLKRTAAIKFMRDPTRGGVATTLNEIAQGSRLGIVVQEEKIPVSARVRAACELLGIDPLYVANEGRMLLVVKKEEANKIIGWLRRHPLGKKARDIGSVVDQPRGRVILKTILGTERIIDMLASEPLPRIC